MISSHLTRTAVAAGFVAAIAQGAAAQSLADRIDRVRDSDVRFSFPVRQDVCGRGQSISYRGRRNQINWNDDRSMNRDVEWDIDCDEGPGRVVMVKTDGEVSSLRFYVGGRWRRSSDAVDLGMVGAREAANYLTNLAATNDRSAGKEAVFPATLVDSVTVWPQLMRIARDERRPRATRTNAVFWLGQLAEEPATAGLKDLVGESDVDREVREQAVFALSQRPNKEGVPALIQIVRTNRDPDIRKKALFWLAQSQDPRALDLIEELLTKR